MRGKQQCLALERGTTRQIFAQLIKVKGAGIFHSASQRKEGSVGFGTSESMTVLADTKWGNVHLYKTVIDRSMTVSVDTKWGDVHLYKSVIDRSMTVLAATMAETMVQPAPLESVIDWSMTV